MGWVESLGQDLRYGARLLRREPLLTTLVLATLALGIGANAAMFTLLNRLLLQPLPYPQAERLTTIVDNFSKFNAVGLNPTVPEIRDVHARAGVFERIAWLDHRDLQITGGDEPTRTFGARVTPSFFTLLGVRAALGRTFDADAGVPGTAGAVVLSDAIWRRVFSADPAIVGKTITLNAAPHTIVGVLPPDFTFDHPGLGIPERVGLYIPFPMDEEYTARTSASANSRRVRAIAQLNAGVTPAQAEAALGAITRALTAEHPAIYPGGAQLGFTMHVVPLQQAIVSRSRPMLFALFAAVGVILLIACANTAQFLLARSLQRTHEVAVRAALGASRARLVRQFLAESILLAAAGGVLGLWLSTWLARALMAVLPTRGPLLDAISQGGGVDARMLLFTFAVSLVTALVCGLLPAWHVSQAAPHRQLLGHARGAVGGRVRSRYALIAVEVALSVVLLVAAGALLRGLLRLQQADHGFSADRVIAMQVRMSGGSRDAARYQEYLSSIATIPGVESAAVVSGLPLRGGRDVLGFVIEGRPTDLTTVSGHSARFQTVSDDFFRTFSVPVHRGRAFTAADAGTAPRVAIVNEEMARRYWPNEDPIGKRISTGQFMTIVGVVGNVQTMGIETTARAQVYVPSLQNFEPNMWLAVRAAGEPAALVPSIKQAVWRVAPDQALFNVQSMEDVVSGAVEGPRVNALLIGAFAVLALIISAAGVYGIVSYLVSRRVREIAVRMAIGAQRADVFWTVAGQTLAWTAIGLAGGLVGARAVNEWLQRSFAGAAATDWIALAVVCAIYLSVAGAAVYVPARRALGLDPVAALRSE